MPNASIYNETRFLDPSKKKPKVPGVRPLTFNPTSLFAGRPEEPNNEDSADNALQGGLAGAASQELLTPFSALNLFRKRVK